MAQPDGSLVFDTKIITDGFKKGTLALGASVTALAGTVVKLGADFEATAAKASTLFGQVAVDTANLNKKILEISSSTGLAATELNEALYSALSAGIPVTEDMAKATGFLESAAKLAKAGFTDTETAISATAKTLNAYKLDVSEAERIQGILIQTQNKGITTVNELGASLAQVTPTAAAFSVSFENVGAALATMTAQGTPTAQATTQLNQLIAELGKNGTTAAKNLKAAAQGTSFAGKSFKDMMESGASLSDILMLIQKQADINGVSMVDMFSSIEAGKSALAIVSGNAQTFNSNLEAMNDTAGLVEEGYEKMMNTLEGQTDKFIQSAKNLGIGFYEGIKEPLTEAVKAGNDSLSELQEAVASGELKSALTNAGTLIGKFVSVLIKLATSVIPPLINALGFLGDNIEFVTKAALAGVAAWKLWKMSAIVTTAIKGIVASFQTANVQLALFTLQNGKAALSSTTLTAALTAKELVVGVLTGKISLLTAAQTLLNKAWAANPVGVVIGGAVALGVALHALYQFTNQETEAEKEHRIALEANKAAVTELTEAYDEYHKRNSTEANDGLASIENLQRLSRELDALVDSNGKVQKADEARVKFILGELNGALGTEAQLVNGVVQNYKDLKTAVEESLKAKQAEILMEEATKNYTEACKNYAAAEKAVAEARKNEIATDEESVRVRKEAEAELLKYTNDKIAYAKACSLAEEGQTEALINYLEQQRNARNEDLYDLEKYNSEHDKQLARKAEDYNRHINTLITLIRGFDGSKEMQDELDAVFADLKIDEEKIAELGGSIEDGLIKGFENGEDYFSAAWTNDILAEVATSAIKSGETFSDEFIKNLCKHLSGNTATIRPFDEFKTVVESTFPDLFKSPMILQSSETNGSEAANYYVQGAVNYANSAEAHQKTYNAYFALGQTGDKGFNDGSGVHSPSVFAEAAAKFYVEGAVLGIKGNADTLYEAVKMLGEEMNDVFEDSLTSQMNTIRSEIASITGLIKEEAEKNVKAFDAELKKIEMLRDFGIDDEETYYRKLEFLRDNYLTKNSDKWIDITQELYDYQEAQLEEHRDNIEDVYDDIADHITDKLDEVAKKQQKFSDSLTDSTELFQKYTIDGVVHYKLNDFSSENVNLAAYQQWLSKAMERVKSSGASDDAISGVLDYIDGLTGDESGMDALIALASASDADFAKFMSGYAQNLSRADGIAAQRYSDDMVTAAEESYQQMVDELAKAGLDIPEGFFVSGTLSAEQFGEAFLSEIELQMQEIRRKLTEFNAEINASIGAAAGNVTNDNRSTTYHIYGDNSGNTVKQIQNMETIKRLSGQ